MNSKSFNEFQETFELHKLEPQEELRDPIPLFLHKKRNYQFAVLSSQFILYNFENLKFHKIREPELKSETHHIMTAFISCGVVRHIGNLPTFSFSSIFGKYYSYFQKKLMLSFFD